MTRLDLTRAMLEKADEVDDEACMLMRWAVSRIHGLEAEFKDASALIVAATKRVQELEAAYAAKMNETRHVAAERDALRAENERLRDIIRMRDFTYWLSHIATKAEAHAALGMPPPKDDAALAGEKPC